MTSKPMGIIHKMPFEEYLKVDALSQTYLKAFAKSPAHYIALKASGFKETPAMRKGKLIHMAQLEPELMKDYVVISDLNRNTTEFKDKAKVWEKKGLLITKTKEMEDAKRSIDVAKSKKTIQWIMDGADHEVSIFWINSLGIYCKARLDILNQGKDLVFDWKVTAIDITNDFIVDRHIWDMGYHIQVAWYEDAFQTAFGRPSKHNGFIFQESKGACEIKPKRLLEAAIELAVRDMGPAIESFGKCLETGVWAGYEDAISDASLPSYAWERESSPTMDEPIPEVL